MKPFDLEQAKAGKPFGKIGGWKQTITRSFLGVLSNGDIAYEYKDPSTRNPLVAQAHPDQLFMITEKRTYTVCLVRMKAEYLTTVRKEHVREDCMTVLAEHTFEYEE